MRTFFLIMTFLCLYANARAQDLIITTSNDSIHCKVTEFKGTHVSYLKMINNQYIKHSIMAGEVKSVQYDVFPAEADHTARYEKHKTRGDQDLMIGVSAGFGYLTAPVAKGTPADQKSHIDDLRNGFALQASGVFFISGKAGVGLMYKMFKTSNTSNILYEDKTNGKLYLVSTTDNITTHFIAPSFWYRFGETTNKFSSMLNVSLGYYGYQNSASLGGVAFDLTTSTAGFYLSYEVDYALTETVSIFAHAGLFGASATRFEMKYPDGRKETVKLDDPESFSRFDGGAGLRFLLF